ncbi:hypothetical protein GCM10028778_11720 [Barrientosiimonas marina]
MYRDLIINNGWKHVDIDNMDINHFLRIMNNKEDDKGNSNNKKKDDVEEWFKSI